MNQPALLLAVSLALIASLNAAVRTETVEYRDGDTVLEGVAAFDDALAGRRPGVLVVHQWLGLGDYERKRAEMLAGLGYVAFCAGIYGKGVRPADAAEVAAFETEMRAAGADWQLVSYGGAVHSFTHWTAGSDNSKGAAYNEKADRRSWAAMQDFLRELFPPAR
jgi:dienelactone hydrolase